jgi:hypothetical protein
MERPLPAGFSRVDEVGKSEAGRFYRTYPKIDTEQMWELGVPRKGCLRDK